MTDITPLLKANQKIIQSYAAGKFRISGEVYNSAVIVTPLAVDNWNGDMSPEAFQKYSGGIDVLIIGSGAKTELLMPQTRVEFKDAGFSVEIMDTGAACRTFNVLTAEGRRVAAALKLI